MNGHDGPTSADYANSAAQDTARHVARVEEVLRRLLAVVAEHAHDHDWSGRHQLILHECLEALNKRR